MDCKGSMTNEMDIINLKNAMHEWVELWEEMNRKEQIKYFKNRVDCTKSKIEYWKTSKSELADELLIRVTLDLKAFELYLKKLRKGEVK